MRFVLDASAAFEIVFKRDKSPEFKNQLLDAGLVLAPDLIVPETTNAVWKYHRFGSLNLQESDEAIRFALGLIDEFVPSKDLYRDAFLLARNARKPVYDMFYLALARQQDAFFLTMDSALKKEAEKQGIQVNK
jgi:predicted nucleic acid-binding protein